MKVEYKYNENKALVELSKYIDSTYDEHYSKKNVNMKHKEWMKRCLDIK